MIFHGEALLPLPRQRRGLLSVLVRRLQVDSVSILRERN